MRFGRFGIWLAVELKLSATPYKARLRGLTDQVAQVVFVLVAKGL